MKKYFLFLILSGIMSFGYAQKDFNSWSIETNAGFNKPMGPLTAGYLSPTLNIGHFDIGVRYMFNEKFGIKGTGGIGTFSEAVGSPEFSTNYGNITLKGVFNWGRILNFETFCRRLTVLGFLGGGSGYLKNDVRPINDYDPDYVYTINTGFATLYKISNRISIEGDISMIVNGRQRFTFDGTDFNSPGRPIQPEINYVHATGTWWTGTLGLNFYLGKQEEHADWYIAADKYATKEELANAIIEIKDLLKDSDGDGISDYLDKEANTPVGARVSFSGITLDSDSDGTPDHLDNCPFIPGPASRNGCPLEEVKEEVDYFLKAINENYVNVYFAFDSDIPLEYSISASNYIANFMKRNPGVNLEVKGYADELGPEDYNITLSQKRAETVQKLLVAAGVDASRLTFKGYGEDTSVDKSSTEARQLARRASFEVK